MQSITSFIPATDERNIASFRRENAFRQELSVIDLETGSTVITARFYGAGSTAYCVLWIWANGETARGYGKAGGYGYHKDSAALGEALKAAGVRLAESIHGVGDGAMIEALLTLAGHFGTPRFVVHHAHA